MAEPGITLAEELRFLGIQCMAQARGEHRDQDSEFITNLISNLLDIAPGLSVMFHRFFVPAANLPGANLPALLMTAAKDLSRLANDLDRDAERRAA